MDGAFLPSASPVLYTHQHYSFKRLQLTIVTVLYFMVKESRHNHGWPQQAETAATLSQLQLPSLCGGHLPMQI
jgi:hypothetical protein